MCPQNLSDRPFNESPPQTLNVSRLLIMLTRKIMPEPLVMTNNANIHHDLPFLAEAFAKKGMTDEKLALLCSILDRSYAPASPVRCIISGGTPHYSPKLIRSYNKSTENKVAYRNYKY